MLKVAFAVMGVMFIGAVWFIGLWAKHYKKPGSDEMQCDDDYAARQ